MATPLHQCSPPYIWLTIQYCPSTKAKPPFCSGLPHSISAAAPHFFPLMLRLGRTADIMITRAERSKYTGGVEVIELFIYIDQIQGDSPLVLFHVWMGVCQHLDGQVIKVFTQDETHLGRAHPDLINGIDEINPQCSAEVFCHVSMVDVRVLPLPVETDLGNDLGRS